MASFVLHCHFVSIPHSMLPPLSLPPSRLRCCLAPKILPLPTVLQNANNGSAAATPAPAASASCGIKLQTKTVDWQHTPDTHTPTHTPTHSCGNQMRHAEARASCQIWGLQPLKSFLGFQLRWKNENGNAMRLPCPAPPRPVLRYPAVLLSCWHPHWQFICHTKCIRKKNSNKNENVLHFLSFLFIIIYFYKIYIYRICK